MRDTGPENYVYDPAQRLLHWLMAAIILTAIGAWPSTRFPCRRTIRPRDSCS